MAARTEQHFMAERRHRSRHGLTAAALHDHNRHNNSHKHLLFCAAEVIAALRFLNKIVRCPHLTPTYKELDKRVLCILYKGRAKGSWPWTAAFSTPRQFAAVMPNG